VEQSLENVDAVGERDAEQGDFAKALVATNIAAKAKGRRRRSSPRESPRGLETEKMSFTLTNAC
jgi:hypothetical protein